MTTGRGPGLDNTGDGLLVSVDSGGTATEVGARESSGYRDRSDDVVVVVLSTADVVG